MTNASPTFTQSGRSILPRWLCILIVLLAVDIMLFTFAIWFAFPSGWTSFFSVPILYVRLAAIAATVMVTALAAVVWRFPDQPLLVRLHRILARGRQFAPSIVFIIPLFVLAGALMPAKMLVYMLMGTGALIGALIVYLHDDRLWTQPTDQWIVRLSIVLILAGLALRIWLMLRGYFGDEGLYLSAAQNMINGGGIAPITGRMPAATPDWPIWGRAIALYGSWARIFGASVLSLRSFGFVIGLIALFVMYQAARQQYDQRIALITAGIVAASLLGLQTVGARNNGLPVLAAALSLLSYLWARTQQRPLPHLLTGLLAALSLETHLLNVTLIAALGGMYAIEYVRESIRSRRILHASPLWFFGIGTALGIGSYFYLHVLSVPAPDKLISSSHDGTNLALGEELLARLTTMPLHYAELWEYAWFELVLMAVSIAAALWRLRSEDKLWLLLLLLNEIGYYAFHPIGTASLSYTSYALPLLLLGSGSLIMWGFTKQGNASPLWQHVSMLVISMGLIGSSIRAVQQNVEYKAVLDAQIAPITDALHNNVPVGSVIVIPAYYGVYVNDYDVLLHASLPESRMAAGGIGMEPDAYWQNIYLETWPLALLDSHFFTPRRSVRKDYLTESYFASRHATQIRDYVWIIPDTPLIIDAVPSDSGPALEIAAHVPLPDAISTDQAIEINTIWIIREQVSDNASAVITLRDQRGEIVQREELRVISGWQRVRTSKWSAYRFHDVQFTLKPGSDLASGQYEVWIEIVRPDQESCVQCALKLGSIHLNP